MLELFPPVVYIIFGSIVLATVVCVFKRLAYIIVQDEEGMECIEDLEYYHAVIAYNEVKELLSKGQLFF